MHIEYIEHPFEGFPLTGGDPFPDYSTFSQNRKALNLKRMVKALK
jgi:hypothetical protein